MREECTHVMHTTWCTYSPPALLCTPPPFRNSQVPSGSKHARTTKLAHKVGTQRWHTKLAHKVGVLNDQLTKELKHRVGQYHIYTVYIRYFWQGNHQIYGVYIRFWPTLVVLYAVCSLWPALLVQAPRCTKRLEAVDVLNKQRKATT